MAGYRIPGPIGLNGTHEEIDEGTLARARMPAPGPIGLKQVSQEVGQHIDKSTRMLAATAYGESSIYNMFEEMAAIANVLVRQQKARGYQNIEMFMRLDKNFAFAAYDGNLRYKQLMAASEEKIKRDMGMNAAMRAARNALSSSPVDYSNGAFFWDGADIKTNYENHTKVRAGINISSPSHNVYKIDSKRVPGEAWWRDSSGKKTKLRGTWEYKYESTAGYGGTIFWKYDERFLKATGNSEYK